MCRRRMAGGRAIGRYLWIDKGCVVDVVFSLEGAVEPSLSWGGGYQVKTMSWFFVTLMNGDGGVHRRFSL